MTTAESIKWQNRPLCCRYLLLQLETHSVPVCEGGFVRRKTVYWGLGVLADGHRDVLEARLEPATGAAHCQEVFEDLQVRGVEEIRFIVRSTAAMARADVNTQYPGATALPSAVHLLRQSLPQVAARHRKLAGDALGAIREAETVQAARAAVTELAASPWGATYPAVVQRWRDAVEELGPFYALGARLRRLVRSGDEVAQRLAETLQRAVARHGCFPSEQAATAFVTEVLERANRSFGSAGPVAGRDFGSRARSARQSSALAGCH